MLYHLERVARVAAFIAVALFFASATWVIWRAPNLLLHADGTLTRTEVVLSKVNATIGNVDKATKVWADSAKAQADSVQDTMVQVRGTLSGAQDALGSLKEDANHLAGTIDASTSLLGSARTTTDKLPIVLDALNTDLAHLTPLEDESKTTLESFNAVLKDQAIHQTLHNVADMTDSGNQIMFDFRKVADKETEQFLKPVKWYMQPIAKGGQLIDIAAAIARHTP